MEEILEKRLSELAFRAAKTGVPSCTRFIEPNETAACERAAREAGVSVSFYGGYEGAERVIACFYDGYGDGPLYPVVCLEISWSSKFFTLSHRDLLGAVMSLGIERDGTGDIAFSEKEGTAYLFVLKELSSFVRANLTQAKRAALNVKEAEGDILILRETGEAVRVTCASLRLDAVLQSALRLSRAETQRKIAGGFVKLNHEEILSCDRKLREGDLLSVRGFGRLRVERDAGETKKGRQALQLRLFKS